MIAQLRRFPSLVILVLIACALMQIPMLHALTIGDHASARAFFYHGAFFAILASMIGIALDRPERRTETRLVLLRLLAIYLVLPFVLCAPVSYLVGPITYSQAWWEMLSCLTTTGATLMPEGIPPSVHLWRAIVGWGGGLLILVAAIAILEPLQLGGFEIETAIAPGRPRRRPSLGGAAATGERIWHHLRGIAPVYAGLTLALMLALLAAGDTGLVATSHAMAVMSTSGITPLSEFGHSTSGYTGEAVVFVFLLIAISRRPVSAISRREMSRMQTLDAEYRLALALVASVSALMFARHFVGAVDVSEQDDLQAAIVALWGTLFNVLSYLSTTGFDSRDWAGAQGWAGLETPGLILMTLCVIGGGIATTAGGVKLLRVFALYKHGMRELQRLIHPNSVGGSGVTARRIRREGAQIAWVFLMLFLIGISVSLLAMTALGETFEDALAFSVAALTNTGPAAGLLGDADYALLSAWARAVLAVGMIFGRLEALVFVSLLNPDYWRR